MFHNRRIATALAAAAIGLSALTVPAATATEAAPVAVVKAAQNGTPAPVDPNKSGSESGSSLAGSSLAGSSASDLFRNEDGKLNPTEIVAWIGVISAVLGIVSKVAGPLAGNQFSGMF